LIWESWKFRNFSGLGERQGLKKIVRVLILIEAALKNFIFLKRTIHLVNQPSTENR
jgi:hypothetical protein